MSEMEGGRSPAAKKASRDATRRAQRARVREIRHAFEADWDNRDADTSNWLDAALDADPGDRMTPRILFGVASRAISELSDATGTTRQDLLKRLL